MSTPRPVLLLAETGLIIRNLLLGTFGRAVAAERPLLVAVSRPNDPRLRSVVQNLGDIELIEFPRRPRFLPDGQLGRMLAWESYIPRFITTGKSDRTLDYMRRLADAGHSKLGGLYVGAVYGLGHIVRRSGLQPHLEAAYRRSISKYPITREWTALLESYQPAAVISTALSLAKLNSHSHDLPVVQAALDLDIPCGTLIQSWDNLTSKPALFPPDLDRFWSWSEDMSAELLRLYPHLDPSKVVEVGSPQFDFHGSYRDGELTSREDFCRDLGFDPARPLILIGTGTPHRLPFEHLAVIDLVERLGEAAPECQCLIRLHPKDDGARWRELEATVEAKGAKLQYTMPAEHMDYGGFVPPKEFFREQATTLVHAAVVVNAASTLTVDSAILDRPSVCMGYDLEFDAVFPEGRAYAFTHSTHYEKLVETGGVKVVSSAEACVQAVLDRLADPSLEAEGRRRIIERVTDRVDGRAGHRLAAEVLALADGATTAP
ncbi:MAG: hypothetical protein AAGM22_01835 [Acidobacteriota bacterium]